MDSRENFNFSSLKIIKRTLLSALIASAGYISSGTSLANATPMADGPLVCTLDGSNKPSRKNPDPLNECPDEGYRTRLSVLEGYDYLNRNYDSQGKPIFSCATSIKIDQ